MVHRSGSAIHHIDQSDPIVDPSITTHCGPSPTARIKIPLKNSPHKSESPLPPPPPSSTLPKLAPHQPDQTNSDDLHTVSPDDTPDTAVSNVLTPRKITRSRLSLDVRPAHTTTTSCEKPRLIPNPSPSTKPGVVQRRRRSSCSKSNEDLSAEGDALELRPATFAAPKSDSKSVPCSPVPQRRTQSALGLSAGNQPKSDSSFRSRKCVKNLSFSEPSTAPATSNLVPKSSGIYCSVSLDRIPSLVESLLQIRKRLDESSERTKSEVTPSEIVAEPLSMDKTLCLYCDRSFTSKKLYAKHSERVHQTAPEGRRLSSRNSNAGPSQAFPGCSFCNGGKSSALQSDELPSLFKHLCEVHVDKYFACAPCSVRFINADALNEHNIQWHPSVVGKSVQKSSVTRSKKLETKTTSSSSSSSDRSNPDESSMSSTVKMEDDVSEEPLAEPALRSSRRQQAMLAAQNASSTTLRKKQMLRNQDTLLSRLGITQNRTTRTRRGCIKPTAVQSRGEPANRSETPNIRGRKNQRMASSLNSADGTNADATATSSTGSASTGRIIFDENFYEMVNANVRQNLSCHLDGKLEGAMSPSPSGPVQSVPSVRSTLVRSPLVADNEIHEATAISALTAFPTLLTTQQYGAEPMPSGKMKKPITKNSWKWKWDCVRKYKYVSEGGKFVKKIKQPTAGLRDLSKLDMWTQLTMRSKHEMLVQQELLTNGQEGHLAIGEQVRQERRRLVTQLDDILDTRILPKINLEQNDQRVVKMEASLDDEVSSNPSTPSTPVKQATTGSDDFPSCLMLQRKDPAIDKNRKQVVLSGEWARPRCYICIGCGDRFDNMKMLDDHKASRHPHVQSTHYEVVGKELMDGELFQHFFIPSSALQKHNEFSRHRLGLPIDAKEPMVEDSMDSHGSFSMASGSKSDSFDTDSNSRISKLSSSTSSSMQRNSMPASNEMVASTELLRKICTKCKKICGGIVDLYRHMLECSGDYAWMLAKKRQHIRHRYFGARRRRAQRTNIRRERTAGPKPERIRLRGPQQARARPSDAESIQRMLADLPAKRTCHQTSPTNPPSTQAQKPHGARKFVSAKNGTTIVRGGRKQILIKQSAGGISTRRFTTSTTAASIAKNMQLRKQKQQQHKQQNTVQREESAPKENDTDVVRSTRSNPAISKHIEETESPAASLPAAKKSNVLLKSLRRKTKRVVDQIANKLRTRKRIVASESVAEESSDDNEDLEDKSSDSNIAAENPASGHTVPQISNPDSNENESKKESNKRSFFQKTLSFRKSKRQVKETTDTELPKSTTSVTSKKNKASPQNKNQLPVVADGEAVASLASAKEAASSIVIPSVTSDSTEVIQSPVNATQSLSVITASTTEPSTPASTPALYSPLQPILVSPSPSTSSVPPQTPSPGLKRRPRKLNDCIAMLTGKLTEKLGIPFLETPPPLNIPKPATPMVLNVPSIPTVQAFLHQHDAPKPNTRNTLTIPTYPVQPVEPTPPPETDDYATPVDLSIPKGIIRNDLPPPTVETNNKRRTPRKRNQRSQSIACFQELIIPSPSKHIPTTSSTAAPVRDTISEVIFAVSRGEVSEETPVTTPSIPPVLFNLPTNPYETDMIPVFRIPTGVDASPVVPPSLPNPITETDILRTPTPVAREATVSSIFETPSPVVSDHTTPNFLLTPTPLVLDTPPKAAFDTTPSLLIPSPTERFAIKLKPMSELLAPTPVVNTRSRRAAKKKRPPVPDVDLLNCSESDTSLVISDPCPGDEFSEALPEPCAPEPALPMTPLPLTIRFEPIPVTPSALNPIPTEPLPAPELLPLPSAASTTQTARTTRNRMTPVPLESIENSTQIAETLLTLTTPTQKTTRKSAQKSSKSTAKDPSPMQNHRSTTIDVPSDVPAIASPGGRLRSSHVPPPEVIVSENESPAVTSKSRKSNTKKSRAESARSKRVNFEANVGDESGLTENNEIVSPDANLITATNAEPVSEVNEVSATPNGAVTASGLGSKEKENSFALKTLMTPQLLIVDCMKHPSNKVQSDAKIANQTANRNSQKKTKSKVNSKPNKDSDNVDDFEQPCLEDETVTNSVVNEPDVHETVEKGGRKTRNKKSSLDHPSSTDIVDESPKKDQSKRASMRASRFNTQPDPVEESLADKVSVHEDHPEIEEIQKQPSSKDLHTTEPCESNVTMSSSKEKLTTVTTKSPNKRKGKTTAAVEVETSLNEAVLDIELSTSKKTSPKHRKKSVSKSKTTNTNPFDSDDEEFLPWDPEVGFLGKEHEDQNKTSQTADNDTAKAPTPTPENVCDDAESPTESQTPTISIPAPTKPRKRRKNELAKIIADQLLESFKQVDQSRIGELKMLHDISIDSSTDDTLLRSTMSYTPPPKRKSASKAADEALQQSLDQKESESDASTATGKNKLKTTALKKIKSILLPEDKSVKSDKKKRVGIRFDLGTEIENQSDNEVEAHARPARIGSRRQTFCAERVQTPVILETRGRNSKKKKKETAIDLNDTFDQIRDSLVVNPSTTSTKRNNTDNPAKESERSEENHVNDLELPNEHNSNNPEDFVQLDDATPAPEPPSTNETMPAPVVVKAKKIRASRLSIDVGFASRKRFHRTKAAQSKNKKSMVNDMVAQIINDFTTSTIDSRNNSPVVFAELSTNNVGPLPTPSSINGTDSLVPSKPKNRTLELLRHSDQLSKVKSPLRAPFMSPRWGTDETALPEEPIPAWHTIPPIANVADPPTEKGLLNSIKNKTKTLLGISNKKSRNTHLVLPSTLTPATDAVKRPLLRPSILNGSLNTNQEKTTRINSVPRLESGNLFVGKDTALENEPVTNIFSVPIITSKPTVGPFSFDAVKASPVMVKGSEVKPNPDAKKESEVIQPAVSALSVKEPSAGQEPSIKPRKMGSIKRRNNRNTPVEYIETDTVESLNTGFLSETLPTILPEPSVKLPSTLLSPSTLLLPIVPPAQLSAADQELLTFDCSQDTVLSEIVNKIQSNSADSDEELSISQVAKNLNSKLPNTDDATPSNTPTVDESSAVFKTPSSDLALPQCNVTEKEPEPINQTKPYEPDCLDMDENTNNDLVDMDLEDTMSVYTSFSIDTAAATGGKRKKRRSRKSIISKTSRKAKRIEDQFLSPSTFHCVICDRTFSSQSGLTSHKSTLRHISKLSEQEFLQSKESIVSESSSTTDPDHTPIIDIPATNAELPCGTETHTLPGPSYVVPPPTSDHPKPSPPTRAKSQTPLSSPVRVPPPPISNTYRPSGLEPISSPEQVDHTSDRYNISSRLSLPMIGSPRQVLSQEERLFYECCSMLKGSERRVSDSPPTYYQLPRIHSSEMIMANNKPVTPRSNEQYSYVVPEGSKGKGTPKIDLNQFSDISSDSNPAYSCPQIPSSSETQHTFARKPPGMFTNNYTSALASSSYGPKDTNHYPGNTSAAMENLSPSAKSHRAALTVSTMHPTVSKYPEIMNSFQSSQDAIENVEHFGRLGQSGSSNIKSADGTDGRNHEKKTLTFERILERVDNQKTQPQQASPGLPLLNPDAVGSNNYSSRSPFDSPVHSASSQSSTVSKPRTKAAMKGYGNFKVSIPTAGIDMQQAIGSANASGCNLAALADIALGNDVPNAVGLIPSVNSDDVESSKTGFYDKPAVKPDVLPEDVPPPAGDVPNADTKRKHKSQAKASAIGNKLGFIHRKKKTSHRKKSKSNERPTTTNPPPKDQFDFDDSRDPFDIVRNAAAPAAALLPPQPPIDLPEDSQVSSYSDRDDFNYENSPSDSDSSDAASCVTKRSVKSSNTTQKKCLIMGRIFKGVKKVEIPSKESALPIVEKVKEIKKPIPKQELDKMFDSLRASSDAPTKEVEKKSEVLPEVEVSTPKEAPAKNKEESKVKTTPKAKTSKAVKESKSSKTPSVETKVKKTEGRQRSRKSKEIASIEEECGMPMDKIYDIMGVGQKRTQRRCTTNKQKTFAETWSSDEYEEFHSTSDIMALIQQAEQKASKAARVAKKALNTSTESLTVKKPPSTAEKEKEKEKKPSMSVGIAPEKSKPKPCLVATPKPKKTSFVGVDPSDDDERNGGGSDMDRQRASAPRAKITNRRRTIAVKEDEGPCQKTKKKQPDASPKSQANTTADGASTSAKSRPPHKPMARRKRNASTQLYYWSSSSSDEDFGRIKTRDQDSHVEQHGWIVGDSHKKLVTLLAHAKGKNVEECGVKEALPKKK